MWIYIAVGILVLITFVAAVWACIEADDDYGQYDRTD